MRPLLYLALIIIAFESTSFANITPRFATGDSLSINSKLLDYFIEPGLPPQAIDKRRSPYATSGAFPAQGLNQDLPVRYHITKFIVEQTPQGPTVRFERVCEEDSSIPVIDLTGGGGLIEEQLIGYCQSLYENYPVIIVLSGMVYDTIGAYFSDENEGPVRNFFSHLSLQSEAPIIFGIGDFNLGSTRSLPFQHLTADLSSDTGGKAQRREGFVATIRYGTP